MTIYLYILKEYLKFVVGTVVLTLFLFILFDFIHKASTGYFVRYNPSTDKIIKYYILQIPEQIVLALPIAGLLASVIAMILLSRTNEITAMRAAGMGPFRIGLPLAVGGMLLSVVSLVSGEIVIPRLAQKLHFIEKVQIEGEKADQLNEGARWVRDGQTLVSFKDYDPITQTLSHVRLIDVRPNFRAQRTIESEIAVYMPDKGDWTLTAARALLFKPTGTLDHIEVMGDITLQLPFEPQKLKKDRRRPNELSVRELADTIRRGEQSGIDTLPYRIDFHGKFAYPFAAFVVSLVGIKFGYKSERATETALGVLFAFFLGISYWLIQASAHALGLRGGLPPLVAAWLPNVATLAFIAVDVWRGRRV